MTTGPVLTGIQRLEMDVKLLHDVDLLPNIHDVKLYEIYDMKPSIGFKVESRSFILDPDMHFKVALKDEFPKEKSGTVQSTGYILFKKALQIFECSNNSTIPASLHLASELESLSWKQNVVLFLQRYFYFLVSLLSGDKIPQSPPTILESKKMPKDKKFQEVFREKYDVLCKCKVIPDCEKKMEYKFSSFIIKKRRHAASVFCGENHSFVLELFYQTFEDNIYNCPNIRYITGEEVKKRCTHFYTIEESADYIVERAIDTVAKMGDYDLLMNNCQNFVSNLLCFLNPKYKPDIHEGQYFLTEDPKEDPTYTRTLTIVYIIICLIFNENSPVQVIADHLYAPPMAFKFSYLIFSPSRLMNPYVIFLISVFTFLSYYKSAFLQFFFLYLMLYTVCSHRPRLLYIFRSLVLFIANKCFSVSILTSIAILLYIPLSFVWLSVISCNDLAITLPRIKMVITFCILNYYYSWGYTVLSFILLVPKPKLEYTSMVKSLLLLLTPFLAQFCKDIWSEEMFNTHFGYLGYQILSQIVIEKIPFSLIKTICKPALGLFGVDMINDHLLHQLFLSKVKIWYGS